MTYGAVIVNQNMQVFPIPTHVNYKTSSLTYIQQSNPNNKVYLYLQVQNSAQG
jgi:hypothetical protein